MSVRSSPSRPGASPCGALERIASSSMSGMGARALRSRLRIARAWKSGLNAADASALHSRPSGRTRQRRPLSQTIPLCHGNRTGAQQPLRPRRTSRRSRSVPVRHCLRPEGAQQRLASVSYHPPRARPPATRGVVPLSTSRACCASIIRRSARPSREAAVNASWKRATAGARGQRARRCGRASKATACVLAPALARRGARPVPPTRRAATARPCRLTHSCPAHAVSCPGPASHMDVRAAGELVGLERCRA